VPVGIRGSGRDLGCSWSLGLPHYQADRIDRRAKADVNGGRGGLCRLRRAIRSRPQLADAINRPKVSNRIWIRCVLGLSALAASISGCAFGDRQVTLNYPPPVSQEAPAPRLLSAPSRGMTIVVERFSDERGGGGPIGEVRNGWGMHTADVLTDTNVVVWAMKAVAHDLAAAGYTVKWAGPANDSERIQMSGQVLTAYCRAFMTYEAEASLMVQLTVDGKQVMNKRFFGRGGSGVNWAATGDGYGESLSIALRIAIADLVAQLQPALRALPPLPPPPSVPASPNQDAATSTAPATPGS
jgi:hypothetical protein